MLKTCVLAGFSITRTTAHSCKFFPVFSAKYSTYKILTDSLQVVMEKLRLSSGPKYYLGAIDQGSSSTRFLLFDDSFKLVLSHSVPVFTESPQPGWAEQSPTDIIRSVNICLEESYKKISDASIKKELIKAIGITNQRETTICWDKITGEPLAPAIVWFDTRTQELQELYRKKSPSRGLDVLREKTGLPLSTYFSVLKLKWMLQNNEAVKKAYDNKRLSFGTVDSWIVYKLLNGLHITDVTNASRTMLMNIETLEWDSELLDYFDLEAHCLPTIRSCSETFGTISAGSFKGIPLSGVLGDQQAALVGHNCFKTGDTKNTFGTGCFLLMNTGEAPLSSKHGLVSTVAYKMGKDSRAFYANEGSVAMSGKVFDWLRMNVGLLKSHEHVDKMAMMVPNSDGVVFLPTFTGVFAPYWRGDITGSLHGLTLKTTRSHICRAAIEAVCFQTRMVLQCMESDLGKKIEKLQVDGGVTRNDFIMQLLADVLGIPIERREMRELTSLGAAVAAGLGVGLWPSLEAIPSLVSTSDITVFKPSIDPEESKARFDYWEGYLKKEMSY